MITTFSSRNNRPKTTAAETGTQFDNEYFYEIDSLTNKKELKMKNTKTNRYLKIQESLESCLIENIIKRAEIKGTDLSWQGNGDIQDFTNLPKNLAESLNATIALKQMFEKLPLEERKAFENSPEKWIIEKIAPKANKPIIETPNKEQEINKGANENE